MSIFDKDWLIEQVNQNPGSAFFPVLSHLYLKDKEINNAYSVCQKGLGIFPESIEGNFIMAQIQILGANLQDAEKTLKFIVNRHSAHVNAWKLLFRIQKDLNRSDNKIKDTVLSLLKIKPNDNECTTWLQSFVAKKPNLIQEKEHVLPKKLKIDSQSIEIPEEIVPISIRMATFTLAEVYQNQGYFYQALEILKMVEKKAGNKRRLKNMRMQINESIKAQLEAETN